MKTKLLLSFLVFQLSFILCTAQVPQGFNYQAVARDATKAILANKALTVKSTIQTSTGTLIWQETQAVTTDDFGVLTLVIGNGTRIGGATTFSAIKWTGSSYYLKTEINPGTGYLTMGTSKLNSIPYALVADSASGISAGTKLAVKSANDADTNALFQVKRKDGQTVFAVYPNAVNIYVPRSGAKGGKGGFAIGGYDGAKSGLPPQDYFRVTPDSVRIYIDPTPAGGKGSKGGFAIGGYDGAKMGIDNMYFNLTGTSAVSTVLGESPQILWYPLKKAFLAGSVHIGRADSVGLNSTALGYRSIAMGDYSQAFGYKAKAFGNYSTSIGKNSIAGSKTSPVADNAFAFGNSTKATGNDSYAFGSLAEATGTRSFAIGSVSVDTNGVSTGTPTRATNTSTIAIGMGAQATGISTMSFGVNSTASGSAAISMGSGSQATKTNALAFGNATLASGYNSTAIGYQSQAQGDKSIAIGSTYTYSYYVPVLSFSGKGGSTDTKAEAFLPIRPITSITKLTSLRTYNRANIAQGQYSVAVGNGNLAQNGGLVFGSYSDADKFGALALGNSASAVETNSVAMGFETTANGVYSVAIGNNVSANSYGEFSLGQFPEVVSGTTDSWQENDQLLTVGNGLNDVNRSNALTIYKNGKTIVRGRYAYSTFNNQTRRCFRNFLTGITTCSDYVYGIYTNLSTDDASIEYYYSGYFTHTGSSGIYYGEYADTRSGGAVDVAEYIYDTKANTEAADVVVADPLNKESVIKSSKPYQSAVVGVISTKPSMTMGMELVTDEKTGAPLEKAKPSARLALTGRVPVKVSGENGAIAPGDYLTTSSTPGTAMKWSLLDVNSAKDFADLKRILSENEKRRGAIIGKAVDSFSGTGPGKIVVLISLQ